MRKRHLIQIQLDCLQSTFSVKICPVFSQTVRLQITMGHNKEFIRPSLAARHSCVRVTREVTLQRKDKCLHGEKIYKGLHLFEL